MKGTCTMSYFLINRRTTQRRPRLTAMLMLLILTAVVVYNPLQALADSVIATVEVNGGPRAVAVNAVTNRIYVGNYDDNTVSVIDGSTNTLLGNPIPIGDNVLDAIALNPTTNRVFVLTVNVKSSDKIGAVSVIDGSTNTVLGSPIPVGHQPLAIAVNPTTNRVYVSNFEDDTVSVIDGRTNTLLGSLIRFPV